MPGNMLKTAVDGRKYLNLACGARTHPEWNNLDFSPYAKLARRPKLAALLRRIGILSRQRFNRLQYVDPDILCYNLLKKLPFADQTFDVVYHSHFLEHLDRHLAPPFLSECHRVLKTGGILRIALPDLHPLAEAYLDSYRKLENNPQHLHLHQQNVAAIFDQMVRVESSGTNEQKPLVRWIEKKMGRNAQSTGELHRWMYDFYSLKALLEELGFHSVSKQLADTSAVPGWSRFHLDTNSDGTTYKPESLFVEAKK